MLDFFSTNNLDLFNNIGVYSTLTLIIVEVLKNYIPKKIPTALFSMLVGIIVTIVCIVTTYGFNLSSVVEGIFTGFITAFVSMYGFDSFKRILNRNGGEDNE